MKYLKIENDKGFYWNGSEYQEIDKINKDDLLALLSAAEINDFDLDPYDESLLGNKAHQVIYGNIYSKFEQFLNDKSQFKKEVDKLYKEAIAKYSVEIKDNDVEDDGDFEAEDEEDISPEDLPF